MVGLVSITFWGKVEKGHHNLSSVVALDGPYNAVPLNVIAEPPTLNSKPSLCLAGQRRRDASLSFLARASFA